MRTFNRVAAIVLATIVMVTLPTPVRAAQSLPQNVLEVVTVPPLPTAVFTLDGNRLATDDKGVARATVSRTRDKHQLQLLTPHLDIPGGSADFVRWARNSDPGQGFSLTLANLVIGRNTRLQAAFRSTRAVRFTFVDQARGAVAPDRITSLTIRSDSGQYRMVQGAGPVTLSAVRPVLEAGSAFGKEVTYYLQSVVIDGTNVVNAGEQRVLPSRTTDATFVVLLRSARFQVRDWLFGHPLAGGIELTYPDGRTEQLAAGRDGDLAAANLARGSYQVKASGAGYSPEQEISLSRSLYVELPALTYVDIVTLVGAAMTALTVLVIVGRRLLRKRTGANT